MAIGFLTKRSHVLVAPDPVAARTKNVRLTHLGAQARDAYHRRLVLTDERWRDRFGRRRITELIASLEPLVIGPDDVPSPLWQGLTPYPDGWRAAVPRPETLPHFPMVLHRGGFPDGS